MGLISRVSSRTYRFFNPLTKICLKTLTTKKSTMNNQQPDPKMLFQQFLQAMEQNPELKEMLKSSLLDDKTQGDQKKKDTQKQMIEKPPQSPSNELLPASRIVEKNSVEASTMFSVAAVPNLNLKPEIAEIAKLETLVIDDKNKEENKGEEEQNSQKKITEDWTQKSISIEQNSDTKDHSAVSHVVDENNSENKSTPLKNAKKAAKFEKIKENNNCNKENQAPDGKN